MDNTQSLHEKEILYGRLLTEFISLAEDTAALLHRLSGLPTEPTEPISASCAQMLACLDRERKALAPLFTRLLAGRAAYEQGRYERRLLQGEDPSVPLFQDQNKEAAALSPLFSDDMEGRIHKLSEILCDAENTLTEFALRAARSAKKADAGKEKATDYQTHIHFLRVRLHDLAMEAEHIRKELDHAEIHTGP